MAFLHKQPAFRRCQEHRKLYTLPRQDQNAIFNPNYSSAHLHQNDLSLLSFPCTYSLDLLYFPKVDVSEYMHCLRFVSTSPDDFSSPVSVAVTLNDYFALGWAAIVCSMRGGERCCEK